MGPRTFVVRAVGDAMSPESATATVFRWIPSSGRAGARGRAAGQRSRPRGGVPGGGGGRAPAAPRDAAGRSGPCPGTGRRGGDSWTTSSCRASLGKAWGTWISRRFQRHGPLIARNSRAQDRRAPVARGDPREGGAKAWPEVVRRARREDRGDAPLPVQRTAVGSGYRARSALALGDRELLHWVLDVTLNEDAQRTRKGRGVRNLTALAAARAEHPRGQPDKGSVRGEIKRAGQDDDFLLGMVRAAQQVN